MAKASIQGQAGDHGGRTRGHCPAGTERGAARLDSRRFQDDRDSVHSHGIWRFALSTTIIMRRKGSHKRDREAARNTSAKFVGIKREQYKTSLVLEGEWTVRNAGPIEQAIEDAQD